eukprot:10498498-Heterocapsa_arctica.AAC.1
MLPLGADRSRGAGRPRSWSGARLEIFPRQRRDFLRHRGRFRPREPWEFLLRHGGPPSWLRRE